MFLLSVEKKIKGKHNNCYKRFLKLPAKWSAKEKSKSKKD